MDRVLVPIDGSPLSKRALEFAFRHFDGATVLGLHVQNPRDPAYGSAILGPDDDALHSADDAEAFMETVKSAVMDAATAIADEFDQALDTDIAVGDPAREIVDYAGDHDVDHIVIGSHGRTGEDRLLLGSVAESVVRRSAGNVSVIRE